MSEVLTYKYVYSIINKANKVLKKNHKIKHTTVQVSGESCSSHADDCNF